MAHEDQQDENGGWARIEQYQLPDSAATIAEWREEAEQHRESRPEQAEALTDAADTLERTRRPELAQALHDEGLIYAINRLVLHPIGLALGVTVKDFDREAMTGTVTGLTLQATEGREPIHFADADATLARAVMRLDVAGHSELVLAVARERQRTREA